MKPLSLIVLAAVAALGQSQPAPRSKGPVVFINGNGDVSVSSSAIGGGIFAAGGASVSKNDPTIEAAQRLLQQCPEITLTLKGSDPLPDYELLLHKEGDKMFSSGFSELMLVRPGDKTIVYASKKESMKKAVKQGCKALLNDWRSHRATDGPNPNDWWQKTPALTPEKP